MLLTTVTNNIIISSLALLASATATAASPFEPRAACTAKYRIAELNGVAPAFSDQTPGACAAFLQQLPLAPNAKLTIYINGGPGITTGQDASTTRDFALGVRQVFYKVVPTSNPYSTDYGNGTTHTELEITAGLLHDIALPVNFHASMNFNWDLSNCQIETLQGYLTIPTSVLGRPVNMAAIQGQFEQIAKNAEAANSIQ